MSLRKLAVSSVKWTSLSSLIITALSFIQLAVLTRMLDPRDFGLAAMVMVVVGYAQAYADIGISSAIIHRQDSTREQLSSLYWLNILAGILVFGLVTVSSPLIAGFFREPRLNDLLLWASLSFLVMPIGQQFKVLLQKELQFDTISKVEVKATVIAVVVSIFTALLGLGVFSLIYGQLALAATKGITFARLGWGKWRPMLRFKLEDLKGYVSFGLYQIGDRSISYLSSNMDYLLIGRFLGSEILGFYRIAYQLVVLPLAKINPILTRVAFPIFAKKQDDNMALQRGYTELIKLLSLIAFPLLIGLAATAPLVVPVFFGKGWELSVPLVQILAPVGMLKVLANPSFSVFLAKGRADIAFKLNLFMMITSGTVFWFVVQNGMHALAWSYVILSFTYTAIGYMILRHVIGLGWQAYLNVLTRPMATGLFMGSIVYASYLLFAGIVANRASLLMGLIVCGGFTYSALVMVLERSYLGQMWTLIFERKRG